MKLPRRNFLHLAAGAAALPVASRIARAEAYPAPAARAASGSAGAKACRAGPVRTVEGLGAAPALDIGARWIGQSLSEHRGQSLVTENRRGAGGNMAAEAVARAPPDGYTLLLIS